jgi:hypothetical protein
LATGRDIYRDVRGEEGGGVCVADDWTLRCRSLLLHPDDDGGDDDDGARRRSLPVDGTADFGEALKSLPARECYRSRLANALDAYEDRMACEDTIVHNLCK